MLELVEAMEKGRLDADNKLLMPDGSVVVTKVHGHLAHKKLHPQRTLQ